MKPAIFECLVGCFFVLVIALEDVLAADTNLSIISNLYFDTRYRWTNRSITGSPREVERSRATVFRLTINFVDYDIEARKN